VVVGRELVRLVRRPREEHGRSLRALRNEDHRVQPDAVAHRNHGLAPDVVEALGDGLELRRRLAREVRVLRARLRGDASCEEKGPSTAAERTIRRNSMFVMRETISKEVGSRRGPPL
jgi:hypothetical protein